MSRFGGNKYLILVKEYGVILNAFEVPAPSYKSAQTIAYHMVSAIYNLQAFDCEIVVKQINS